MTHVVHTAHGIMRQDTEGGHHGGTQLVLSPMPKTGMQTLEIAQEELPKNYFWWRRSTTESKICCPYVIALQMSCPRQLTIIWTFAVWSSAVTNKRCFTKVFSTVDRTSDCRMKSSVGSHGSFFKTFKRLQQSCFSSTEQHLAPCQLSQVHTHVSQHVQCSRQNCTQCTI